MPLRLASRRRGIVHVDVVEDEPAAVQVDDERVRAGGHVEAAAHAVGVDVLDAVDRLTGQRERSLPRRGALRGDVERRVPRRHPTLRLQRSTGLRVERHRQRAISASRATATAAATRKSTRWSGTVTV
jgi:hypothetical protein